jgi:hypothetical protein
VIDKNPSSTILIFIVQINGISLRAAVDGNEGIDNKKQRAVQ